MQKFSQSIVLLVIGAFIGLSVGMYISTNQTPNMEEQIKVTIQDVEYSTEGQSILKIELLNDAPEKSMKGNITVYQAENSWTNAVSWHYTSYGEVEITCDSISEK